MIPNINRGSILSPGQRSCSVTVYWARRMSMTGSKEHSGCFTSIWILQRSKTGGIQFLGPSREHQRTNHSSSWKSQSGINGAIFRQVSLSQPLQVSFIFINHWHFGLTGNKSLWTWTFSFQTAISTCTVVGCLFWTVSNSAKAELWSKTGLIPQHIYVVTGAHVVPLSLSRRL